MKADSSEEFKTYLGSFLTTYHFTEIADKSLLLTQYLTLLLQKNEVMNLTSSKTSEELCNSHLRDSLELFHALPESVVTAGEGNVLDIGSGGGFPGIVASIIKPGWNLYLLESITKKAKFLSEVVEKLSLQNTTVKNCRAETFLKEDTFQKFDIVMARAVGKIDYLYPLFKYFVKPKGLMVFWKKMEEVEPYLAKYPMKRQKKHLYEVADGKKSILIYSV
jgi:16S rRNA (guanine527-N7)-methyltransferase